MVFKVPVFLDLNKSLELPIKKKKNNLFSSCLNLTSDMQNKENIPVTDHLIQNPVSF